MAHINGMNSKKRSAKSENKLNGTQKRFQAEKKASTERLEAELKTLSERLEAEKKASGEKLDDEKKRLRVEFEARLAKSEEELKKI